MPGADFLVNLHLVTRKCPKKPKLGIKIVLNFFHLIYSIFLYFYYESSFSVIAAKLFSSAGTGFTYTFRRPRTSPKFELRKFDPVGKN